VSAWRLSKARLLGKRSVVESTAVGHEGFENRGRLEPGLKRNDHLLRLQMRVHSKMGLARRVLMGFESECLKAELRGYLSE
jgi:hypothetical protein